MSHPSPSKAATTKVGCRARGRGPKFRPDALRGRLVPYSPIEGGQPQQIQSGDLPASGEREPANSPALTPHTAPSRRRRGNPSRRRRSRVHPSSAKAASSSNPSVWFRDSWRSREVCPQIMVDSHWYLDLNGDSSDKDTFFMHLN